MFLFISLCCEFVDNSDSSYKVIRSFNYYQNRQIGNSLNMNYTTETLAPLLSVSTNENTFNESYSTFSGVPVNNDLSLVPTTPNGALMKHINNLGYVMVPLLFITGSVGNLLTIIIMTSKAFRKYPVSCVLTALAVSDITVNLLLPFNRPFVRALIGIDPRSLSAASCKVFYFTYRVARITSSWMVVILTNERFVAVWFPSKARYISTKRNTLILMCGIFIIIVLEVGYLCSLADQVINGVCIPNFPLPGKKDTVGIFMVMGLSLYAFIPSTILIIFNILIVIKLVRMKQRLQIKKDKKSVKSKDVRMIQTTMILLGVSVAFIVLVNPSAISHLVSYVQKKSIFEATDTGTVLYREISSLLEQINNSVNFFFYVLGSAKFRKHVFLLFRYAKCTNNSVMPLTNAIQSVASGKDAEVTLF